MPGRAWTRCPTRNRWRSRTPPPSCRGPDSVTRGVRLGLRASLSIRTTGDHGGWLRLAGAPPQIRKLFGLVALDRLLDFHDSTDAALADV